MWWIDLTPLTPPLPLPKMGRGWGRGKGRGRREHARKANPVLERSRRDDAARQARSAAVGTAAQDGGARVRERAVLPRRAGPQGGQAGFDPVAGRSPRPALHHQRRPARAVSAEVIGDAEGRCGARARLLRHDRQADRHRLQRGRPGHVGRGDGAGLHNGRLHKARRRPQRARLRPVHRRTRVPPGRGAARWSSPPAAACRSARSC
jgi:hypothetical protein